VYTYYSQGLNPGGETREFSPPVRNFSLAVASNFIPRQESHFSLLGLLKALKLSLSNHWEITNNRDLKFKKEWVIPGVF